MQHLTGLDAAFLAIESPSAHMHVLGIAVVDPSTVPDAGAGTYYERVRRLLEARIHLVPPLRRRLVTTPFGLYVPGWVEDPDFDLEYHLRRAALPSPGGPHELEAFVADFASRPLDRRYPLWEAYVVEGLEHGYQAFVAKLHHSMIDGVAGVSILSALFDLSADAPFEPLEPAPETLPASIPSDAEMLGRAVVAIAQRPAKIARAVVNSVPGVVRAIRRARDEALDLALPLTAPRLAFNRTITPHRVSAFSSVALDDVKAVKNALGVSVNDVVIAVTAGAMRTYLEHHYELPDRGLVAAIPTSVREEGDPLFGNKVSSMFATLPVEIDDPLERVRVVSRVMIGAKNLHADVGGSSLEDWAETASPILFTRAMRAYSRLKLGERLRPAVNLVLSNVPGPPFPLYFAGAQLAQLHPLGPIFDDISLNLTVISYLDHIDFGFIACRELIPDLDEMAAAVPDALAELMKAAGL